MYDLAVGELMSWQTLSLKFAGGVDTKSDIKLTAPTKLITLQNGIFTNTGRITKRNGYDSLTNAVISGGTWSSPTMAASYRNELLIAATISGSTGPRLLSYSDDLAGWADRGKYVSIAVSKSNIASAMPFGANPNGGTLNSCGAVSGNLQAYAYENNPYSSIGLAIIDSTTGMHLEPTSYSAYVSGSKPRLVTFSATTFGLFYIDAGDNLVVSVVTVTEAGGVVVSAPTTIGSTVTIYNAQATSTGAIVAYCISIGATTTLFLATINTSGTVAHTANITSAGQAGSIYLNTSPNTGHIWVYWASGSAGSQTLYYSVFSAILGSILGKTSITSSLQSVKNIVSIDISTNQQTVYYSVYDSAGVISVIHLAVAKEGGSPGTPRVYLNNVDIYSEIATMDSRQYLAVMFTSNLFPTGFLVDLQDGLPVAKFLPDQAEGIVGTGTATAQRAFGFINNLISLSGTQLLLAAGVVSQLSPETNTTSTGLVEKNLWTVISSVAITFDLANIDAYQAINHDDTLLLNGGLVYQYDGSSASELGFSVDPEVSGTTASSGGGGGIGTGQWIYYATYEWTDAKGNLHQSAPSTGYLAVFASGTTNSVSLAVRTLTMTQKSGVNIVIWRTTSNGTIAYRLNAGLNDPTVATLTFVDLGGTSDATLQNNQPLYTQGGAILENLAPPPALILWSNDNRAWVVDSENPETTVEYSKTAAKGYGTSFSTGQLELIVDSKKGAIQGASPMDEKTVILKAEGLGYFYGDGANDAGTGSTITPLQFVPSDVGCTNGKSVLIYPGGVIFRSSKGIYQITRGIQVQYMGADVESFNSQDVLSAVIISDKNQIRFLTSSGSSLLFDYYFNQWSTFTNHTGLSATNWNGSYVYVRTDGSVYLENTTSFLDDTSAIAVFLRTAWIKAASVQNFQRVRAFELLGDYQSSSSGSSYGAQVSFAYDFVNTFTASAPFYFDPSSASKAVFQEYIFTPRQKCNAVRVQIAELPSGASGEYFDLSDLDMEIMLKQGMNKLAARYSTG